MTATFATRRERGELVGAGFFVFHRGRTSKRIKLNPRNVFPFEHASLELAITEAERLAAANPGMTYAVFQQIGERRVAAMAELNAAKAEALKQ